MDALEFLKGTDAIFQKTQNQYADMQGFVAPKLREGTVLPGGGLGAPFLEKPLTELPTAPTYDASSVGRSVDPARQTTTQRNDGGSGGDRTQAPDSKLGFGEGWVDMGPMGRAALTMAEALPTVGMAATAAKVGMNMNNVSYANNIRSQMDMEPLGIVDALQAMVGLNSYGRNIGDALGMNVDTSNLSQTDRNAVTDNGFGSTIGNYDSTSFGAGPSLTDTFSGVGLGVSQNDNLSPGNYGAGAGYGFGSPGSYGNDSGGSGGKGGSGNDNDSAGDTDSSDGDADGHGDTGGGSW